MQPLPLLKFVPAFGWGGTERQFVNLGVSLDPSRFAVHFGCLRRFGVLLDEIDRLPVLHYDVSSLREPATLAAQIRLMRDIRRRGIRIVHTYGFHSHLFAIPAAKLAGARVVASIRDMGVYLSPRQQAAQRLICRFADRILVNAAAVKDWLVSDGYDARRITIIPNGIDLARFERPAPAGTLRNELGVPDGAPLIGVVGRVSARKGIEDFLAAAGSIRRRFPDARFAVIGEPSFVPRGQQITMDDSYSRSLVHLSEELGLAGGVTFTGFRPDVVRLLPELTVSVMPSHSEGLSNTLLESMAAGLPVVATRVGGSAEVIDDGENGLLVAPHDPDAIAAAVCRLLESPAIAQRIGEAARRHIINRYSMERVVESTSHVYDELLN